MERVSEEPEVLRLPPRRPAEAGMQVREQPEREEERGDRTMVGDGDAEDIEVDRRKEVERKKNVDKGKEVTGKKRRVEDRAGSPRVIVEMDARRLTGDVREGGLTS